MKPWKVIGEFQGKNLCYVCTYVHSLASQTRTPSAVHVCDIQSNLTYPHTSVVDDFADKVREPLTCGSNSAYVRSRTIADMFP